MGSDRVPGNHVVRQSTVHPLSIVQDLTLPLIQDVKSLVTCFLHPYFQITPDTLRFLLPALCHLIVEEKSRQILLDMKIQEILYTYLSYHWTVFDSYKKWLDEQV